MTRGSERDSYGDGGGKAAAGSERHRVDTDRLFNAIIARQFKDAAFPFARARNANSRDASVYPGQLRRSPAINGPITRLLKIM